MRFMYLHWWFLIRLIDVIDVLKLVVPDMADWCCETGGFWYDPLTYIYLQTVGMVYPISTYISNWIILPKLLAAYIQYNWIFYRNVHFPTLCPKGTQKPYNLHSSSNCWHGISNINLHIQLSHTHQIVGIAYSIQIYIFINVHFHRNHQS